MAAVWLGILSLGGFSPPKHAWNKHAITSICCTSCRFWSLSIKPPSQHINWTELNLNSQHVQTTENVYTTQTLNSPFVGINVARISDLFADSQWQSAVANWPARRNHAVDRAWPVINWRSSIGARRCCQLSWPTTVQFITRWASLSRAKSITRLTIDMPWRNCRSLGQRTRGKYPYF